MSRAFSEEKRHPRALDPIPRMTILEQLNNGGYVNPIIGSMVATEPQDLRDNPVHDFAMRR